jgi:hypothetical protein
MVSCLIYTTEQWIGGIRKANSYGLPIQLLETRDVVTVLRRLRIALSTLIRQTIKTLTDITAERLHHINEKQPLMLTNCVTISHAGNVIRNLARLRAPR